MELRETLERLCSVNGPSGFEKPAAEAARAMLAPLMDETRIDRLGNLIGVRRCGRPGAKKLLLDAHLDEVGFLVTGMEDGFLKFRTLGGVDPRLMADREVTVLTDPPIFGVVACLAPHVQKAGDSDKTIPMDQLSIDIGMTQEQAEKAVPIGTPITYRQPFVSLGDTRVCAKALDDRSCFVTLLRAADLLRDKTLDVDLYLLGSVCEEVGGRGAMTAAYGAAPDYCVAVDVTFARSSGMSEDEVPCKLGGGPAIGVGPVIPRWMSSRLKELAERDKLPFELEIMSGRTGTNGDDFQTAKEGIPTAVVSLPLQYMHTPVEIIDLEDIEQTARLLAAFAESVGKEGEALC